MGDVWIWGSKTFLNDSLRWQEGEGRQVKQGWASLSWGAINSRLVVAVWLQKEWELCQDSKKGDRRAAAELRAAGQRYGLGWVKTIPSAVTLIASGLNSYLQIQEGRGSDC